MRDSRVLREFQTILYAEIPIPLAGQKKKPWVITDTSTNLLCSWCGVSMPQTSMRCSTSWGNRGFHKKVVRSPWWTLKYLFNMLVTPGKVLLGEGRLLLACCGYIRQVNFILRNSGKNGMECKGLCCPCGKHNPIIHFYGKQSIQKGMEFLQYSGAHRITHKEKQHFPTQMQRPVTWICIIVDGA